MNKNSLFILLSVGFIAISLWYFNTREGEHTLLMSTQGCCYITITKDYSSLSDTIYTIKYSNTINGEDDMQIENSRVDADYMINIYQDYCLRYHPK